MSEYMTEQRRELLEFFRKNHDRCFNARDVAEALKNSNISISAIYRNLSRLERDGYLSRTVKKGSRESYYQSMMLDNCRNRIHLSCIKCGNTFHMDNEVSAALLEGVSKSDGFSISKAKTVLYGVCGNCGRGGKNDEI